MYNRPFLEIADTKNKYYFPLEIPFFRLFMFIIWLDEDMEVRIDRGRGEVSVETEVFILLFWLVREFINNPTETL
jgi:hypothetical protein